MSSSRQGTRRPVPISSSREGTRPASYAGLCRLNRLVRDVAASAVPRRKVPSGSVLHGAHGHAAGGVPRGGQKQRVWMGVSRCTSSRDRRRHWRIDVGAGDQSAATRPTGRATSRSSAHLAIVSQFRTRLDVPEHAVVDAIVQRAKHLGRRTVCPPPTSGPRRARTSHLRGSRYRGGRGRCRSRIACCEDGIPVKV